MNWLREQAQRRPGARAVRHGELELTYAELAERAGRAAAALAAAGVGPGGRVAVRLPDGLSCVVAIHAVAWLGAVLVPVHHRWGTEETAAALEAGPPEGRARSHRAADRLRRGPSRVELLVDDPAQLEARAKAAIPEPAAQEDDASATILFTSGTTGAPRPVPLTHGNHRASAEASAAHLGVEEDDDWLCCLPLSHVGGLAIVLRSVLYGTSFTLVPASDGFDPERVGRLLASGEVTLASLVPTMLRRLLELPAALDEMGPPHDRVRAVLLGGGPADPELVARALDAGWPVRTTYGMTESASQVVTMPGGAAPRRKLGAAGVPLPGVELEIVDAGGLALPVGETGTVRVRGAMISKEVSAASADAEGWLETGDLGRLDGDGYLWIEGRRDEVIVTGGENVSPAEVEAVLRRHPQVADCAVLGLPDPEWGRAVVAAVVPRDPGEHPKPGDLTTWCRTHLAGYKVPKRIVVLSELPRTSSGKVALEALRERY